MRHDAAVLFRRGSIVLFALLLVGSCRSTEARKATPPPAVTPAATPPIAPANPATRDASTADTIERLAVKGYPAARIDNGKISAIVYLPDAKEGYYRTSRFDWSGIVSHVDVAGVRVFGPWTGKHNPLSHDDISGPANEFSTLHPPGYDEASVGEGFLKIGVGELRRTTTKPFIFPTTYPILRAGEWTVSGSRDSLRFVQDFSIASGWGYHYAKQISLPADQSKLIIHHTLTNTGDKTIKTDYYTHNFFRLNDAPIPLPAEIVFAMDVKPTTPDKLIGNKAEGNKLLLTTRPAKGKAAFTEIPVPQGTPNRFELRTNLLNIAVTCDHPASKFAYYGRVEITCPEPYMDLTIEPGKTLEWTITYDFAVPAKTP